MIIGRSGVTRTIIAVIVMMLVIVAGVAAFVVLNAPVNSNTSTSSSSTTLYSSFTNSSSSQQTSGSTGSATTSNSISTNSSVTSSYTSTNSTSTSCVATNSTSGESSTEFELNMPSLFTEFSAMTVKSDTTTGTGSASSTYAIVESYDTIYASQTTFKIGLNLSLPGEYIPATMWMLRDGTVIAFDYAGQNNTGSDATPLGPQFFALFLAESNASDISAFTSSAYFHQTGTSPDSIGPTQVSLTTYSANALPETISSCPSSTTITAFSFALGIPHGTNTSLIVNEQLATTEDVNGTTSNVDVAIQLSSLTLASTIPPPAPTAWNSGAAYPLLVDNNPGVIGQSCVNSSSTMICVGGIGYNDTFVDNVYSAGISSSGMGNWTVDQAYPTTIGAESCVSYTSYVYCVGGLYGNEQDDVASTYYAQVVGGKITAWQSTTPYPVSIDSESCVTASGDIYCVGGENETSGTNSTLLQTNSDWYAQLSSSGIGTWMHTTAYPPGVGFPTCTAASSKIYCIGGLDPALESVNDTYYASLSSTGIGRWSSTTAEPIGGEGQGCGTSSGYVMCVGGIGNATGVGTTAVYYAPITATGVGAWQQSVVYPIGIETGCLVVSGDLYCAGGYSSQNDLYSDFVFYAAVESLV
jgi:hypothetical protein